MEIIVIQDNRNWYVPVKWLALLVFQYLLWHWGNKITGPLYVVKVNFSVHWWYICFVVTLYWWFSSLIFFIFVSYYFITLSLCIFSWILHEVLCFAVSVFFNDKVNNKKALKVHEKLCLPLIKNISVDNNIPYKQ